VSAVGFTLASSREWGRYRSSEGRVVSMRRKGQRVRFFDVETGEQVGPEQSNVVPAVCAAAAAKWWDLEAPRWMNLRMFAEVAR